MTKQTTNNKQLIALTSMLLYLSSSTPVFAEDNKKISLVTFSGMMENKHEIEESLPDGVEFENREEAIVTDNKLIAKAEGISIEEANKGMLFQERFTKYVDKLVDRYPNMITTAYLKGNLPNQKGYVKFVKEVPKELLDSIKKLKQENKIILTGGGKISEADNIKRAQLVMKALTKLKYTNMITYPHHETGQINIELKISTKKEEPTKEKILDVIKTLISEFKLTGEASFFSEDDIKLTTSIGTKPIITLDKTRGGSRIYRAGSSSVCTSAWSVIVRGLGTGVMTAGHCMFSGKDRIVKHLSGGGTSRTYNMIEHHNALEVGDYDVGVYHTPTTREEYKFWADENRVRYTYDIRTPILNSYSCVYGRSSNDRSCHRVIAVNQNMVITPGGDRMRIYGLVKVSVYDYRGDYFVTENGDSGGGWSYGGYAMGVHSGHDSSSMYFTNINTALRVINGELY